MLDEAADPPGPLDAAAPLPVLLPPLEEAAPPVPELLVPPVAPESVLDELEEPEGVLGALDEEDDDPPGTMIVSFSFVVDDVADPLGAAVPPGTTVVVSLRSQAESAKAPIRTNR